MSRYNNKTYRVDDIDWEKNPQSTFSTRNGEVSFVQYYENAYNKKITDMEQPLLVSMPKKRVSLCQCVCVCVLSVCSTWIHPSLYLHTGPASWYGWAHSPDP